MQTVTVPANRGWRWLFGGFALYRRNPPVLGLLVILYWLLMGVINVVPYVGQVVASMCIPAFSVGIMNACRDLERGRPVALDALFSGFRRNNAPLFALGSLYLALTLTILAASSLADGGTLMQLMLGGNPTKEELEAPGFVLAANLGLVLMLPVLMAYWFAPMLVAWHGFSAGKALFFSFFACLRNWRAFLGYALAIAVWGVALPGLVLGVIAGLLPGGASFAIALFSAPLLFILAPTLFASFYVTYREVFVDSEPVDVHA